MTASRTVHYPAFEASSKVALPEYADRIHDGDAPTLPVDADDKTYIVLHDLGFDEQSDGRLSAPTDDVADGTYRVVARCVSNTRQACRAVADDVKSALTGAPGVVLTIPGRTCGRVVLDGRPGEIVRDDKNALFYVDLDFTWRSCRS